jgi:hypothetical protein
LSSAAKLSSRWSRRAAKISRAPVPANAPAHDLPIPELAPVIRTTLFFNETINVLLTQGLREKG